MTFIKFCGLTREADVRLACELGVDAIGFVLWPHSPRWVEPTRVTTLIAAMPNHVIPVGIMVQPSADEIATARATGIRVVQIHGGVQDWPSGEVWIATHVHDDLDAIPSAATVLLDAHDPVRHGGTGQTIDWERAAAIAANRPIILAGGLTPDNVGTAVRRVKPFGVDVSSGIEDRPGEKNAQAMQRFVAAVRETGQ